MKRFSVYRSGVRRVSWVDIVVAVLVFGLLYAMVKLGTGMGVPFSSQDEPRIVLHWWLLPYYTGRSLLRMFIAFIGSLLFSFVYGRIAASYRLAEKIMIPLLDILQSVPVLGFMAISVTPFMNLFPHSLLGVELASIFAIFTSQVWNITFGFYQSIRSMPRELQEASKIMGLDSYGRFTRLELPFAMITLVWNGMMSFGGSWFFLAASEALNVDNLNIQLPGIGSYMARAIQVGNMPALLEAMLTMVIVIVLVDQLVWRPLVAWSQKFKLELSNASEQPQSWFLQFLRRSTFADWVSTQVFASPLRLLDKWMIRLSLRRQAAAPRIKAKKPYKRVLALLFLLGLGVVGTYYGYIGAQDIAALGWHPLLKIVLYGVFTALRVFAATVFALIWTIPVGVAIGLNPKASRIAQPLVQIASSFPANMFFPWVTLLYIEWHVNFQIGAIPLMMLGTQWYILFNVIAGAMAIPNDLKEASKVLHLSGWEQWKRLLLPAIFPYVITGCITASGGAWNASIIAELVQWKQHTLVAAGLGALITEATKNGQWPVIVFSIAVMAILVTLINRSVWRPLLRIADTRFRIEISGR